MHDYFLLLDSVSFAHMLLLCSIAPILNPAPDNRGSLSDNTPPRDGINPNNVFGFPSSNNANYPQMPPLQPLDTPRLPDNRQAFPASPNQGNHNIYQYPYHPDLTPPPNIFHFPTPPPNNYYNIYKPTQPSRSSSTIINNASLNLTLFGLLFLLIYRISNNLAWILLLVCWFHLVVFSLAHFDFTVFLPLSRFWNENYFWYILVEKKNWKHTESFSI